MAKICPVWPQSDLLIPIDPNIAIAIPNSFYQQPLPYINRVRELGFNALVLGFHDSQKESAKTINTCLFEAESLALIIKPVLSPAFAGCPTDPKQQNKMRKAVDALCHALPDMKGLFWESNLLHPAFEEHSSATDATKADLVFEEIKCLEEVLQKRASLIFYVPFDSQHPQRQAKWMRKLCERVGPTTTLAFSCFQGAPWHDHLPLHPLWTMLQPSAPLMPILNTGLTAQGEGRWPNVPFDLYERCLSRCRHAQLGGPIALTGHLPGYGGTLECSLWIGTQEAESAELLAEKWLRERRPELSFEPWRCLMKKGRELGLALSALKQLSQKTHSKEICRLAFDHFLASLKLEKANLRQHKKLDEKLEPYFQALIWDAHRELEVFARTLNISFFGNSMLEPVDHFWETAPGMCILKENFLF